MSSESYGLSYRLFGPLPLGAEFLYLDWILEQKFNSTSLSVPVLYHVENVPSEIRRDQSDLNLLCYDFASHLNYLHRCPSHHRHKINHQQNHL